MFCYSQFAREAKQQNQSPARLQFRPAAAGALQGKEDHFLSPNTLEWTRRLLRRNGGRLLDAQLTVQLVKATDRQPDKRPVPSPESASSLLELNTSGSLNGSEYQGSGNPPLVVVGMYQKSAARLITRAPSLVVALPPRCYHAALRWVR